MTPKTKSAKLGCRLTRPAQVSVLYIWLFPLLMQLCISLYDRLLLSGHS
ncbi:MAG: hypothetical protein ACOH2H_06275 [Cypionkella sp.]